MANSPVLIAAAQALVLQGVQSHQAKADARVVMAAVASDLAVWSVVWVALAAHPHDWSVEPKPSRCCVDAVLRVIGGQQ